MFHYSIHPDWSDKDPGLTWCSLHTTWGPENTEGWGDEPVTIPPWNYDRCTTIRLWLLFICWWGWGWWQWWWWWWLWWWWWWFVVKMRAWTTRLLRSQFDENWPSSFIFKFKSWFNTGIFLFNHKMSTNHSCNLFVFTGRWHQYHRSGFYISHLSHSVLRKRCDKYPKNRYDSVSLKWQSKRQRSSRIFIGKSGFGGCSAEVAQDVSQGGFSEATQEGTPWIAIALNDMAHSNGGI